MNLFYIICFVNLVITIYLIFPLSTNFNILTLLIKVVKGSKDIKWYYFLIAIVLNVLGVLNAPYTLKLLKDVPHAMERNIESVTGIASKVSSGGRYNYSRTLEIQGVKYKAYFYKNLSKDSYYEVRYLPNSKYVIGLKKLR